MEKIVEKLLRKINIKEKQLAENKEKLIALDKILRQKDLYLNELEASLKQLVSHHHPSNMQTVKAQSPLKMVPWMNKKLPGLKPLDD